jgi:FkbM family methyltransferase
MSSEESVKRLLKAMLRRLGYRFLRESSLPRGLDPFIDLKDIVGLHEVRTIVDVGANVGQTIGAARIVFPDADIVAFEPTPGSFEILRSRWGRDPHVRLFQTALGKTSGKGYLQCVGPTSELNRIIACPDLRYDTLHVSVQTLDEVAEALGLKQINLLKIDTEGHEVQVLQGAQRFLDQSRVRAVLAEASFDQTDERHTNFFDLFSELDRRHFSFLGLYDVHHLGSCIHYCNALFVNRRQVMP